MNRNCLIIILLSVIVSSCSKDNSDCGSCHDEHHYVDLDTNALNRLNFDGTEQLVYENAQGAQLTFEALDGLARNSVDYQTGIDCFECGWATRYEYQDRQYVNFECDQTNWKMEFDNRLARLDIRFHSITWNGVIAQYDGTTSINQSYNTTQYVRDSVTLNGNIYYDVFEYHSDDGIFYFTEQSGIVGFWHPFNQGDLYTLVP